MNEAKKEKLLRNKVTIDYSDFINYMRAVVTSLDGSYGNMYLFVKRNDKAILYVYHHSLDTPKGVTKRFTRTIQEVKDSPNLLEKVTRSKVLIVTTKAGKPCAIIRRPSDDSLLLVSNGIRRQPITKEDLK